MTIAMLEALTFGLGRLADAARAAGHDLVLLTADRSTYTHELSRLGPDRLRVVDVDTTDVAACERVLRDLPDLAGLISSTDTWAIPGADLAHRLGLPGPDPEAVRTLRDKAAVRARLHDLGLSRSGPLDPVSTRVFPLVLKDSAGTSSRAVWLCRSPAERDAALREAAGTALKGRLIAEPYFEGPLYSAETIGWRGRTRLLGVLSRVLSPEPACREEASAFPVAFPEADLAGLDDWVGRVLAAAGHERGFAHTEFVLTADGPELVEVNARIGGALVGEALCRSLGVNAYESMVQVALGVRPDLLDGAPGGGPATGFVALYPREAGVLEGWTGLDRLPSLPGAPEWYPTARPGDVLEHLTDQRSCTGIVLAEGPTAELALHRASAAAGGIIPQVRARDHATVPA
ncbi:ATP-grasp domain-containing protein [Saccharothrix australiensis]|uniref:ATP-grasp domain-containing protein n=1 Tax=Saccharothrix australiensis TaxID=2072 RepID=A0A495W009_9PSEU|nr:ATP-grasp domain-containing protein [Saccharothrix australiensis]RKT54347.1 ATP-grasp domain-containing protein [Saccharothrix australiensis]